MTHEEFENEAYADRYAAHQLTVDEELLFEPHLMECPRCQDAVEAAQGLRQGLRLEASRSAAPAPSARTQVLALAAAVLFALGGLAWSLRQAEISRREAGATTAAFENIQRDLAAQRERLETQRRDHAEAVARLQHELDQARSEPDDRPASTPLAGLPFYLLATLRDAPNELELKAADLRQGFTLALDAAPDTRFASYRVELRGAGGRALFERGDLSPNSLDTIPITFPAGFLTPGDYHLLLQGVAAGGERTEVARHAITVR